ncbi:hypothetical protein QYE76_053520 [Lolium multiflorum]|uniref:Reverse transcriptase zinc-binding domain-containing protein n=1 Tax=Lolium multiflorum TaxID=4521 RepID=A0AAD8SXE1_LOLMU|nr:hypothetical protein QYE76_053520 [Lolium multiflorum]
MASPGSGCAIVGRTESCSGGGVLPPMGHPRWCHLDPEREDSFVWRWSADRNFSARSAYAAFFAGTTVAPVASEIWRSRAPYSCKFFAWLVSVTDVGRRIGSRGVACAAGGLPLCDQEQETLQHLLLGCVVAREVWAWALTRWNRLEWMPGAGSEIVHWWTSLHCPVPCAGTCGRRSSLFSGVSGGIGMTWCSMAPPRRWRPFGIGLGRSFKGGV